MTLQLKKYEPVPWMLKEYAKEKPATTPSEWFSKMFPQQARIYGCPFIESREKSVYQERIIPLAMNVDFFAAILGGDVALGHQVVYLLGEMQFYFKDPRSGLFLQTSEDKLGNLLRALLLRCAEESPDSVHKLNLFLEFRSDKQIRVVIMRAKSVLAADPGFFGVDSSNKRKKGPECHEQVAKLFVRNCLVPERDKMVTVPNAYGLLNQVLTKEGLEPLRKSLFRGLMSPLIKQEYDLSLRHDLVDENHRWHSGWKHLMALDESDVGKI